MVNQINCVDPKTKPLPQLQSLTTQWAWFVFFIYKSSVNKFSIDLGERGEKAIIKLLNHGAQMGILPLLHQQEIFIK